MKQVLKIEYDMEEMFLGIKDAVKTELETDISEEIRNEVKAEIKQQLLEQLTIGIKENTQNLVQDMMVKIYETEKISIGGSWQQDPTVYSLKEYVIEQVKDCITNNTCSGKGYSATSFQKWFTEKCVDSSIKGIIEREIKNIRDNVNNNIKEMFNDSTKKMLSETVLNVLMANDTYKKIESNIGCIANRAEPNLPQIPELVL